MSEQTQTHEPMTHEQLDIAIHAISLETNHTTRRVETMLLAEINYLRTTISTALSAIANAKLMIQARDAKIAELTEQRRWIKPAERLPDKDPLNPETSVWVLLLRDDGFMDVGYYVFAEGTLTDDRSGHDSRWIAWMPLPSADID